VTFIFGSMKKALRIRKNEEFQEIIGQRRFYVNDSFALYYRKKQGEQSRFGISVGKKQGNAVLRNKIRRQVRMMMQELDSGNWPFDGILVVRSRYHQADYRDNKKQLESLLKKVIMDDTGMKGENDVQSTS